MEPPPKIKEGRALLKGVILGKVHGSRFSLSALFPFLMGSMNLFGIKLFISLSNARTTLSNRNRVCGIRQPQPLSCTFSIPLVHNTHCHPRNPLRREPEGAPVHWPFQNVLHTCKLSLSHTHASSSSNPNCTSPLHLSFYLFPLSCRNSSPLVNPSPLFPPVPALPNIVPLSLLPGWTCASRCP